MYTYIYIYIYIYMYISICIYTDCEQIFDSHLAQYVYIYIFQDGDKFWKIPECYIRGNSIKYLRIPDEVIDLVSEEVYIYVHMHVYL
jgi:hypothetical protein